jgi:hypothetical protein
MIADMPNYNRWLPRSEGFGSRIALALLRRARLHGSVARIYKENAEDTRQEIDRAIRRKRGSGA